MNRNPPTNSPILMPETAANPHSNRKLDPPTNSPLSRPVPFTEYVGTAEFANAKIDCAVLRNGLHIATRSSVLRLLGRAPDGPGRAVGDSRMFAKNLLAHSPTGLVDALDNPIRFEAKDWGTTVGFPVEVIPQVIEMYIAAGQAGVLRSTQIPAYNAALAATAVLLRTSVKTVAGDVTGWNRAHGRHAGDVLRDYVDEMLHPWEKRFPDNFYRQIHRLYGIPFDPSSNRRSHVAAQVTNEYVYRQLAPGVLERLDSLTPRSANGNRAYRLHQHLKNEGVIALDRQIMRVVTVMEGSRDIADFQLQYDSRYIVPRPRLALDLEGDQQ